MELWQQLRQAGLVPLGLGPPPQALTGAPPEGRAASINPSPGADSGGTRECLLWLWEELGNLRQVDIQLLGQLCRLGLEMGALREEMVSVLEEEEEEDEEWEEQDLGQLGPLYPAPGQGVPDFEMII